MLYGNLIFIKKTGGDGSKFPVTERAIKIGRSNDCLVRIHNSQVELEHCQLIIEDNGQTTLRNLSNQTILNGKPLHHGDTTLCHGDIFKLGERMVRWEYLPTSQYYRQLLSPNGRLVAVVKPQRRSLGNQATPGTSTSQISVFKNTLGKRRFCERGTSESSTPVKKIKSSRIDLIHKTNGDLPKFLTSCSNAKTTQLLLSGGKVKERKSTAGVGSKTKGKLMGIPRKSLPSWKVKILSPPVQQPPGGRNNVTNKKSGKPPKNAIKTPLKNAIIEVESPQKVSSSVSKSELKTPQKMMADLISSEVLIKSNSKSVSKSPLKSIRESPSNTNEEYLWSRRSFSKSSPKKSSRRAPSKVVLSTPKQKPLKSARLVQSESKLNCRSSRRLAFPKRSKRMSLIFENTVSTQGQSLKKKLHERVRQEKEENVSDSVILTTVKSSLLHGESPVKENRTDGKSIKKTPAKKIPGKSPRKSSLQKTVKRPAESKVKTPKKSLPQKISNTSRMLSSREVFPDVTAQTPLLIDLDCTPSPKKAKHTPRKSAKGTVLKKMPGKLVKSVRKSSASAGRRISIRQNETVSPASPASVDISFPIPEKSSVKETSLRKSSSPPKTGINSPRGVRRKLSPSSSAERAAKKLKTSSPRKPDKNKKAALLVLGKANRKQNVKVLLKQKIVKKAIKQSTAGILSKGENAKKAATKLKKRTRKTALTSAKKSALRKKKEKSVEISSPLKASKESDASAAKSPAKSKTEEENETVLEVNEQNPSEVQTPLRLSTKGKPIETPEKSASKQQNKKSESPRSIVFFKSSGSLSGGLDRATEAYLFSSNRRCSKRLSSKNDTGRPDFIELSPTALGLIPKNVNIFKTTKESKRRSSSLVTPKNVRTAGIIKSASTSKIGNRKIVRFSSKDMSYNTEMETPNTAEKAELDFSFCRTPNVTVDMFVSPLTNKTTAAKDLSGSNVIFAMGGISKTSSTKIRRSSSEPQKCVRKLLQSPQTEKTSDRDSPGQKSLPRSNRTSATKSTISGQFERQSKATHENKSPKNDISYERPVHQPTATAKPQKSPENSLSDLRGLPRLLRTPKNVKSPKNDLTDVRGVKKLFQTPKTQKSPRDDLTDVRGVKKLMRTPKTQKSPKNDLADVEGVKQLLGSPRVQKSPNNDLSDLRGVKRLLGSPRVQKSPKNDLSDVTGVRKLLGTPRIQKSPKNNLVDISGIGNLFLSPTIQTISTAGVEVVANSPQPEESLSKNAVDASGVKQLLISKSPESASKNRKTVSRKFHVNDYRAIRGRRTIYSTPKIPKNDLSDVTGVRELFSRHKPTSDYNISYTGVAELFDLPDAEITKLKPKRGRTGKKSMPPVERKSETVTWKQEQERRNKKDEKTVTRRGRLRKPTEEETLRGSRSKKAKPKQDAEEKPVKQKSVEKIKTIQTKKSSDAAKESKKVTKMETKTCGRKLQAKIEFSEGVKGSRKRKVLFDSPETPPSKLKRKLSEIEKSVSKAVEGTSRRAVSRPKKEAQSDEKVVVKRVRKVAVKTKNSKSSKTTSKVQLKIPIETGTKPIKKVQNRSQRSSKANSSDSEGKVSPRKTRSAKGASVSKSIQKGSETQSVKIKGKKVVKGTPRRSKVSPVVKRSNRRK